MAMFLPGACCALWFAWVLLAPSGARADCTLDQVQGLLQTGFSHEQVTQLCAGLRPPGDPPPSAVAPRSQGTFASDVLTPEIGVDGVWKKYLHDGNYVLQNKSDPGAGFILLAQRGDGGWRSFRSKVRFTHEKVESGLAGAALAYESGAPGGDIVLFSLQVDGTVAATRNSGQEMIPLAARTDPAFAIPDWSFVELAVARHGGTAEFLVGGRSTGLTAPVQPDAKSSYGIAVFGIGSYEFRDFDHPSEP